MGLLAVELFLTENDEILINEVAPRPHNSGHLPIEASYTSQFEQHLRAVLNSLGIDLVPCFVSWRQDNRIKNSTERPGSSY